MHILIAAIGRAKPKSPEFFLTEEYTKRLPWKLQVKELELKKSVADAKRKSMETALLLQACAACERTVALDEKGTLLSSREFAGMIQSWQNEGVHSLGFIIGGSDGLDQACTQKMDANISFGRMSFPHQIVRALLAEQLYRAYTLLTNHPYHRE